MTFLALLRQTPFSALVVSQMWQQNTFYDMTIIILIIASVHVFIIMTNNFHDFFLLYCMVMAKCLDFFAYMSFIHRLQTLPRIVKIASYSVIHKGANSFVADLTWKSTIYSRWWVRVRTDWLCDVGIERRDNMWQSKSFQRQMMILL